MDYHHSPSFELKHPAHTPREPSILSSSAAVYIPVNAAISKNTRRFYKPERWPTSVVSRPRLPERNGGVHQPVMSDEANHRRTSGDRNLEFLFSVCNFHVGAVLSCSR